jgi:APA family basic amino acid/polyamine antiporter
VAGADRVAAEMMRKIFSDRLNAVSIAALISIFAALNGSILSGSRVPYAAAREGYFFRAIAGVHPIHRTPGVSIWVLSAWGSVLVLSGKYDDLFNLVIFASWILYGMTAAAVIVLRRKRPTSIGPIELWISPSPGTVCPWRLNPGTSDRFWASSGIFARYIPDLCGNSFLFTLEEAC